MAKGDVKARFVKVVLTLPPDGDVTVVGQCNRNMEGPDGEDVLVDAENFELKLPRAELSGVLGKLAASAKKSGKFKDIPVA